MTQPDREELAGRLVQELTPDQGETDTEAFRLALQLQAALRQSPSVEEVARGLYEQFWQRNGGDVEPFEGQADAIRTMWRNIADDACRLYRGSKE